MSRVDLSSGRVEEVVLDEEHVLGVGEINGDIVADLKVTIQPEEPLGATVHGVVEGNKTIVRSGSKEILVVVCGDVLRLAKTRGSLIQSSSPSTEKEAAG